MDATMLPPGELLRFGRSSRRVHRATALLMGVCLVTAAALYVGPVSVLVGRRALVADVHVLAGLALPVPVLLGWLSRSFRADVRRLNRFSRVDWEWLRSADRRSGRFPVGKFNAGQKLNASLVTGGALVLLGSGTIMRFANHWPLSWRTGATFVHDWFAFAVTGLVLGHLWFALRDPVARAGMRTGLVPLWWARREHLGWADEQTSAEARPR
jgi:cytochrome b subunit of formate dehydrogenase